MQRGEPQGEGPGGINGGEMEYYNPRGRRGRRGQMGDTGDQGPRGGMSYVKPWHVNVALIAIVITLIGGSLSLGQSVGGVRNDLNRNCRILNSIQADIHFLILEHSKEVPNGQTLADEFRQIEQSAGRERC